MDILGYKMFLLGGAAYGINRWLYKRYFNPKTQTRFIEAAFKRKFSGLQPTLWKKSRLKGVTLHIDLNQGNQPIDAFFATKKEGLHLDVCEIVVINSKRILDPQTPEFSIVKDYTKLDDISMKELFMAINKHGLNENPHVCGLRISPPDQNSDLERRKSLRIEFDSVDRYLGTKKLEKMFKSKIEISEEELNDCFVFVFDHDQKQVIWLETARRDDQRSSMSRLVSHILAQKVMRSFPVKMDLSVEALEGISAVDNFEVRSPSMLLRLNFGGNFFLILCFSRFWEFLMFLDLLLSLRLEP